MADNTGNNSKFEKLTPILEYTYVVLYNMLNTTRSVKNYIDAYARDMDLKDLEQYEAAMKALDEAIKGLTESAKNIGAIYGLPEDMLHPEKMMQELGEQIKRMQERGDLPATSTAASMVSSNASGVQAEGESMVDAAGANTQDSNQGTTSQSSSQPTVNLETDLSQTSSVQAQTSESTATLPGQSQEVSTELASNAVNTNLQGSSQETAQTSTQSPTDTSIGSDNNTSPAQTQPSSDDQGGSTSTSTQTTDTTSATLGSGANTDSNTDNQSKGDVETEDDEIQKILEQLKALRNNQ